jgi:hypothetical protein
MPVSQTANNAQIAFKAQSGIGVPASGAGATGLRVVPSQGIRLTKNYIPSNEIRRDGQSTRGRHGSRQAGAQYSSEFSVGSFDALIEAVLRGTFQASLAITQAQMTSITTTTSTIVAAAGSWLTQLVRRGDKVQLTGHATAANNGKWFRVVSVTALTITVAGTPLVLDATPDATFTLTVAKTVVMGATPVERYFTLDDYGQDIDLSISATDMKVTKIDFNAAPNANVVLNFTFMGLDVIPNSTGASPVFTSPTYAVTLPLVMSDGTIRINGVDYTILTGFSFSLDLSGQVPAVIGAQTGPDVFLANAKLSGSFTAIRQDLTFLTAFKAETPVDFFIDCVENEADPKDFASWYVGNASLTGADGAWGADGPYTETVPWEAGKDEAGTDHAATMLKFATSAA